MSETNAQEPTMEEILASIRRIISEDDAPAANVADTPPAAVHAAEEVDNDEDVLELTQPLDPPMAHTPEPPHDAAQTDEGLGDLDVFTPSLAPPPPAQPAAQPAATRDEPLLGAPAATAAASYFGALSRTVAMPAEGRTLEDVVTALLRPMLKDWLDTNLPRIVEKKVNEEVDRIARGR